MLDEWHGNRNLRFQRYWVEMASSIEAHIVVLQNIDAAKFISGQLPAGTTCSTQLRMEHVRVLALWL